MTTFNDDLLVGLVSGLMGGLMILAAALNHDWCFRYVFARLIDSRFGRTPARWFYVLLGVSLVVLGVTIARGPRVARAALHRIRPRDEPLRARREPSRAYLPREA